MSGIKISDLPAAAALTGTELVPITQSSSTVATTPAAIKTYTNVAIPNSALANVSTTTNDTTVGDLMRNGDWGFASVAKDVPDLTVTDGNYSQIGRLLAGATGGPSATVISSFVALPLDGTPTTAYVATASGRLWTGYKAGATATPTWTEYATLDSPAITTRMAVGGGLSTQALINSNTSASSTGNAVQYGLNMTPTIQSDVVTAYYGVRSAAPTAAAAFTLPLWCGYQAGMISVGAGSTITNAYGIIIDSSVGSSASVTNAYGLYSNLASGIGTSRWNLYSLGSAPNYMAGALGIGSTGVAGYNLRIERNLTGGTGVIGVRNAGTIQSDATSSATMFDSVPSTAATAFTCGVLAHYRAQGVTIGAGSTVTNQYGFRVLSNLTGATNNFAFQSDVNAAANVWNLYLSGTAQNYIRGNVGIGSGKTTPATALDVAGTGTFTNVAESTANTLTALGTNLGTALALTASFNVVTSAAAGTGVALPNIIGCPVWVFNNQATNAINVYPPTGTLNGSASVSLAATGKMQYIQVASGVWYTMS